MITRFAPSPTGWLHAGHAYAAWVAWRMAQATGGTMLLRQEDIDFSRVREEYYGAIEEDLQWLGITWPEPVWRQSSRTPDYEAALDILRSMDVVYPCFCTRKEIAAEWAAMGRAPQQGDGMDGPPYPRTCKNIHPNETAMRLSRGDAHAWRLDMTMAQRICGPLEFLDRRFGKTPIHPEASGDVVVARKDIGAAYHLAVVVDDAAQDVSLVTRGEDLFAATAIHVVLQKLLGHTHPEYLHHPLVCDAAGRRLAKRHDALALRDMRASGVSPSELLEDCEIWLAAYL